MKIKFLVVILFSLAANYFLTELITPSAFKSVVKTEDHKIPDTELPIVFRRPERQVLEIFFNIGYFQFDQIELRVNDCVHSLTINGNIPKNSQVPFCNSRQSRKLEIASYLLPGQNVIHASIENKSGLGYFIIRPVWSTKAVVALWVLRIFAILGLTLFFTNFFKFKYIKTLLLSVTGFCLLTLFLRLQYESIGPRTWDSTLYWGLAQGVLSGQRIYPDFFESKSPLIMILSIPIVLSSDPYFTSAIIQLFFLILTLACFAAIAFKVLRSEALASNLTGIGIILSGVLITLFSSVRSGEFQVESFGAAVAILYLYLFTTEEKTGKRYFLTSGFLLFVAIGLKEPFLLTIFAAVIVCANSINHFYRGFLLPAVVATFYGLILFGICGWLQDYIFIYLKYMIFVYTTIGNDNIANLVFKIKPILSDLKSFSPVLHYLLISLSIVNPAVCLLMKNWQKFLIKSLCITLGWAFVCIAVGMGRQYYNHYYVFALPFYAALIFNTALAIDSIKFSWPICTNLTLIVCLPILAAASCKVYIGELDVLRIIQKNEQRSSQILADYVDETLKSCKTDQYVWIGGPGSVTPLGLTKHKPIAALNVTFNIFEKDTALSAYIKAKISAQKPIVISTTPQRLRNYLGGYFDPRKKNFIETLPACARPLPDEAKFAKILFPN